MDTDSQERKVQTSKEDRYSFMKILYKKMPADVSRKKFQIELPEDVNEKLEEVLTVLPAGYKSSKVRVIYSLLSQFLDDQKEDIMEYFSQMQEFKK